MSELGKKIKELQDPRSWVRMNAIMDLRRIHDRRAVDAIIGALSDADPKIQQFAAEELGEMRNPMAVDPLIEMLHRNSANSDIPRSAAWALGRIGDAKAAEPLLKAIQVGRGSETSFWNFFVPALLAVERKAQKLLCANCYCRLVKHEVTLDSHNTFKELFWASFLWIPLKLIGISQSWRSSGVFKSIRLSVLKRFMYYACPQCHGTSNIMENVTSIIAVFDHSLNKPSIYKDATLVVNWFNHKKLFDFDEIWILSADDFDIENFVMRFRNDLDEQWRKRLSAVPVYLNLESGLSKAKQNLLRDTFSEIMPLTKDKTSILSTNHRDT